MIGLFIVVELTKFFSDLLHFLIIVILLDLAIFVVNVAAHADACIDLHGSNPFSGQKSSNVGLDFDK